MIRIGYVTTMDLESQAAWSGTIHTIYKAPVYNSSATP